jgi:hypothetical protein
MGSSGMIYIPSFTKFGSGIQKLLGGYTYRHIEAQARGHVHTHTHIHTRLFLKPTFIF